jgi:hypothetical protein
VEFWKNILYFVIWVKKIITHGQYKNKNQIFLHPPPATGRGRKSCVRLTTATLLRAFTSLEASSCRRRYFPASNTEERGARSGRRIECRRRGHVVPFLPRSHRLGCPWSAWCGSWSRCWLPLWRWASKALCTPLPALFLRAVRQLYEFG